VKRADIGVGLGLIVLSTWIFWYAESYVEKTIYFYGPNFFPQALAVLMCLCAVVLIVRAARGRALPRPDRIDLKGFGRMVIAIGMCIGYLLLMQVIGFALGTMLFLFVMMTFLRQRGLVKRAASSVFASLAVWAIFRYFLIIPLPEGMFAFTF